ncbi:hypothetical protein KI387_030279, partial [Taxus chinensis]
PIGRGRATWDDDDNVGVGEGFVEWWDEVWATHVVEERVHERLNLEVPAKGEEAPPRGGGDGNGQ